MEIEYKYHLYDIEKDGWACVDGICNGKDDKNTIIKNAESKGFKVLEISIWFDSLKDNWMFLAELQIITLYKVWRNFF